LQPVFRDAFATRGAVVKRLAVDPDRGSRERMPVRRSAAVVGRSPATISRFLATVELSSLKALEPAQPVVLYEREAPGELLHMGTKKLGRIV
jgi:hypothetical protein